MDNKAKVLEVINKFVLSKYIEKMISSKTKLIKLYTIFPYTGAPNWSDSVSFIMFEDIKSVAFHHVPNSQN